MLLAGGNVAADVTTAATTTVTAPSAAVTGVTAVTAGSQGHGTVRGLHLDLDGREGLSTHINHLFSFLTWSRFIACSSHIANNESKQSNVACGRDHQLHYRGNDEKSDLFHIRN